MKNQQGAPEALPDPSPDQLRAIARTARNSSGSASDDCGPLVYVLYGWRAAAIAFRAQQAALVEAQRPTTHVQNPAEIAHVAGDVSKNGAESNMAPQPAKAESLRQILTDPENQPNQYGVQFLMHGAKMAFKIGNRQFCLDYEPDEPGEFEFMRDALISAFSTFTPDVKMAQQPAPSAAAEVENLRKALQFYADKEHFTIADEGAWDTVSGEPQNYWCDEEGTATVEDGTIARLALAGHQIKFDADEAPQPSPTPQADSQPAVAFRMPPVLFEKVADGIEVGYDVFGGVDIRLGGDFVYVHINYDYRYTDNATRKCLADQIVGLLTTPQADSQPAAVRDYPQLPDFDTVEQHIYGACRRYITQDMLEPIHNLIRDAIDADRAARAPADSVTAPAGGAVAGPGWQMVPVKPTPEMLRAGDQKTWVLPALDCWRAMLAAAPAPPAQAADSVLEDAALSSEQQRAILEAYESAASESYFEVRPQIDCSDRRRVFKAGYERGWDAARKQGGAT